MLRLLICLIVVSTGFLASPVKASDEDDELVIAMEAIKIKSRHEQAVRDQGSPWITKPAQPGFVPPSTPVNGSRYFVMQQGQWAEVASLPPGSPKPRRYYIDEFGHEQYLDPPVPGFGDGGQICGPQGCSPAVPMMGGTPQMYGGNFGGGNFGGAPSMYGSGRAMRRGGGRSGGGSCGPGGCS